MKTDVLEKKVRGLHTVKRNRLIFYSVFIAVPVVHFLVFYVYINFNSILLAFRNYSLADVGGFQAESAGFANFAVAWKEFVSRSYLIWNSLIFLAVDLFIVTPLALLFSFYLYKGTPGSGFFKVILFMPQLLSGVILGLLYKYVATDVYLWFADIFGIKATGGLLDNADTQIATMIVFNALMGFGVNVLLFVGSMSSVNASLVESAKLDGATAMQEFRYIILPMIYSTVATIVVIYISHLFTNQANLYTMFGNGAGKNGTVGYFLYVQTMESKLVAPTSNLLSYPVLSALGFILTAIILPSTLIIRYLANKYGPRED